MSSEEFVLLRMRYEEEAFPAHHGCYYLAYLLGHQSTIGTVPAAQLATHLHYCWFLPTNNRLQHFLSGKYLSITDHQLVLDSYENSHEVTIINDELRLADISGLTLTLNTLSITMEVMSGKDSCSVLSYPFHAVNWTGAVCKLVLAESSFYLSATERTGDYTDVRVDGSYWSFIGKDVTLGQPLKYGNQYYLRNVTFSKLLKSDFSLTNDVSQACLYTISGGVEGTFVSSGAFTLSNTEGVLSHNSTLADSASMKVMFPSPYTSEIVTRFDIFVQGFPSNFELHSIENYIEMYKMAAILERLKYDFSDLNSEMDYLNYSENTDFCISILKDLTNRADLLRELHSKTTLTWLPMYTEMNMPKLVAEIYLKLLEVKDSGVGERVKTEVRNTGYPAVALLLIQLLTYSRAGCLQINSLSSSIVQHIYSEPRFSPQVFSLTQSVLSPSQDLPGMVTSFRSWLDVAHFPEVLPLYIMTKLCSTVFHSRSEWTQYENTLTATRNDVENVRFGRNGDRPVVRINRTEEIELENILENKEKVTLYLAKLIDFVTSLDEISNFEVRNAIYPDLNLSDDLLDLIIRSTDVNLHIRIAALRAQTARIRFNAPIEKSIFRNYTLSLKNENNTLNSEIFALNLPVSLSEDPVISLKFLQKLLKSVKNKLICYNIPENEIQAIIKILISIWMPENEENYSKLIKKLMENKGIKTSFCLSKLINRNFQVIKEIITIEEQKIAKMLFLIQENEEIYRKLGEIDCENGRKLKKVVEKLFIIALEHKIPIKNTHKRVFNRLISPKKSILKVLNCISDYSEPDLSHFYSVLIPQEPEKSGLVSLATSSNLLDLSTFLLKSTSNRLNYLSNPHFQVIFRKTKWYKCFFIYWVRVYARIYDEKDGNEGLMKDLYPIAGAFFRLFQCFMEKNKGIKSICRRKLTPLVYYLGVIEQGEWIRDLCEFSHYQVCQIPHILHHITQNYPSKGLKSAAFDWFEVLLFDCNGENKKFLQEKVCEEIGKIWNNQLKYAHLMVKILGFCCVGNENIRKKCVLMVSIPEMVQIYSTNPDILVLNSVLFALVCIHLPEIPSKSDKTAILSLLNTAIDYIEAIPALPNLIPVLHSGLYPLITSPTTVNLAGKYGNEQEQRTLNHLNLLCSGGKRRKKGGIVGVGRVWMEFIEDIKVKKRLEEGIRAVETVLRGEIDENQPILKEIRDFFEGKTDISPQISIEKRPKIDSMSELMDIISEFKHQNVSIIDLFPYIYSTPVDRHHLMQILYAYSQKIDCEGDYFSVLGAGIEVLGETWDPKVCEWVWRMVSHLVPEYCEMKGEMWGQVGKWVETAREIRTDIVEKRDSALAVQRMKIRRLITASDFPDLTSCFLSLCSQAMEWVERQSSDLQSRQVG